MKHSLSLEPTELYEGVRGDEFYEFISGLLRLANVKNKYIKSFLDEDTMKLYNQAFTHISFDPETNYEMFELLGDITANKILVWYFYRRFPQLNHPLGVKVIARLRINYGAKVTFSSLAENLGFWKFISASVPIRETKKKSLLEDTFEAFIGLTENVINTKMEAAIGETVCYTFVSSVLDKISVSLKYEDLFDAKTRLKEIFDSKEIKQKFSMTGVEYESAYENDLFTSRVFVNLSYKHTKIGTPILGPDKATFRVHIGSGTAALKASSELKAAESATHNLRRFNIYKEPPAEYKMFAST